MSESVKDIENRDHFSYVTRCAIRLFNEGKLSNVTDIAVEPEYGYTTRLSYDDGSYRVTYGNDLGLNPAAACDLAKDKGHTKFMLRHIGVNTPQGREFLLPWWADQIGPSQIARGNTGMRTADEATEYIEQELGYPAYVKPVSGSKGLGVCRVDCATEVKCAFDTFNTERVRVAIVEQAVHMPDYRVVVLDGELISAYLRKPLSVRGDGKSTISELIAATQQRYMEEGRDTKIDATDTRITQHIGKAGLTLFSMLPEGKVAVLNPISNLSAGGTSEDVTSRLHQRWSDLAAYISSNFNLRLCGVDLACADIEDPGSDYSVLEVNASPGLDHYASAGKAQQEVVDSLYTKVLNAYPAAA